MIPVIEALARLFALVPPPQAEDVPLTQALGRVLLNPVTARRDQPPFAASAMDGYAVADAAPHPGATYRVIGHAAAGGALPGPWPRARRCASSPARRCPKARTAW